MTPKALSAAPSPPPQPTAAVVPPPALTSNVPTRPAEEERIEPAKSAYTPVNLPAPKKLKNPFAAMEQQQSSTPSPSTPNSGKKLTWSERQALAKKQVEEEEARSRSAAFVPSVATPTANPVFKSSAPAFGRSAVTPSAPRNFGAIGAAAGGGVAIGATAAAFSATSTPPPPPPPPAPVAPASYSVARAAVQDAAWGTEESAAEYEAEPEPEPEPEPQYEAVSC